MLARRDKEQYASGTWVWLSLSISAAVRCLLWLHMGFSAFNVTLYSRMCFVEWVEG